MPRKNRKFVPFGKHGTIETIGYKDLPEKILVGTKHISVALGIPRTSLRQMMGEKDNILQKYIKRIEIPIDTEINKKQPFVATVEDIRELQIMFGAEKCPLRITDNPIYKEDN